MFSFSSLVTDTRNFIRNNFTIIIATLVSVTIIGQLLIFLFYPDINKIEPLKLFFEQIAQKYNNQITFENISETIQSMPEGKLQQFAFYLMHYLLIISIILSIVSLLSMTAIIALLYIISYKEFSLNNLLQVSIKIAPKIIQLFLLTIGIFVILLIISSIIPPLLFPLLLLFTICFYLTYMLFLAVIIDQLSCFSFINTLKIVFAFLKRETSLIVAIMTIWSIATVLMIMLEKILASSMIMIFVIEILKLFLTFATLCYLYRLYSLSNKILPYDSCN